MKGPNAPLEIELWQRKGETGLAELFLDSIPLFRKDLVTALEQAGVDCLEVFPATLTPPKGRASREYRAVNILQAVKCADLRKSDYEDPTGTGLIAVSFRKLVIDNKAALGRKLFRLAEAVESIIVHDTVTTHVAKQSFKYLRWTALVA